MKDGLLELDDVDVFGLVDLPIPMAIAIIERLHPDAMTELQLMIKMFGEGYDEAN